MLYIIEMQFKQTCLNILEKFELFYSSQKSLNQITFVKTSFIFFLYIFMHYITQRFLGYKAFLFPERWSLKSEQIKSTLNVS